jgi:molybdopterin/thiamine biosynthesis adenylyltransferase/rhodanese-related sulfurtransferase
LIHPHELTYYARHLALDGIGLEGQQKLNAARVLCIGAGGLGCPLLLYLAGAGVGSIGIMDGDKVELSNLHRQVLYTINDVGTSKAETARQRLTQLNPYLEIIAYPFPVTANNIFEILSSYDIIVDCTDNFSTRYLINDACFHLKKPNVQASVHQFEGNCSIFTAPDGPCYRCLFDSPPPLHTFQNCAEAGVLGALPGVLGSFQAMEVIKLITGLGQPLIGRVLVFKALSMTFHTLSLKKSPHCPLCAHQQPFDALSQTTQTCQITLSEAVGLSAAELKTLEAKQPIFMLDVRDPYEHAADNLGGQLIPLSELPHRLSEIDPRNTIVIYCKKGPRSQTAAHILKRANFNSVFYLAGGIEAWRSVS